jgi:hypothetical protein
MTRTNQNNAGKRKRRSPIEEFIALPDAEKHRVAEGFNREYRMEETKPLSAKERQQWQRILRKDRMKQRRPNQTMRVSVQVKPSLLSRLDAYAKSHGLSRSELFSRGVERILKAG